MLSALRRHPFPIKAFFRHSLVLTFAFPEEILRPLLPPGLTVDGYEGNGFLAIALVQTEGLRPSALPAAFGRDFFLSGYRIFSRCKGPDGKELRGLRILRSDADKSFMVWGGNLFTHYRYRKCSVESLREGGFLDLRVVTPGAEADLSVRARVDEPAEAPPEGSPFPDLKAARRFAGPLPHTFSYEPETRRLVVVKGVRENWTPMPVRAEVERCTFLDGPPFRDCPRRLANAFFIENIPYRWERGRTFPVAEAAT